jgi:peptidoglycan/xylan/chitin deacetylase (PgdA/CDA1 family)
MKGILAASIVAAALLATLTTAAGAAQHHTPVPILMYHVIGSAPPGAAYPELYVAPRDFEREMRWLARHGYHGVTLRRVSDYWTTGRALPSRPVVISFDDGYTSHDSRVRPILLRLRWPGVLNLKVGNLNAEDALPPRRVRNLITAGWEIDAHTITHVDLRQSTMPDYGGRSTAPVSKSSDGSTLRSTSFAIQPGVTTPTSSTSCAVLVFWAPRRRTTGSRGRAACTS